MPAYIVKVVDKNELVGFFVVQKPTDLVLAIDEVCDPSACEFKKVTYGAVLWNVGCGEFDKDGEISPEGAELNEDLQLHITDDRKWRPVEEIYGNKSFSELLLQE